MIELSQKSHIIVDETKEFTVCYNLISEENNYSIECYVENSKDLEKDYYMLKNFTRVKEIGVHFLKLLVKASVLPVHINDVWEDYTT